MSDFIGTPTDRPLALLPVRLETRFSAGDELMIRVFPEPLHLAPEPEDSGLISARVWGLPDRFVAVGTRGTARHVAEGAAIPATVRVSAQNAQTPAADRWLVDFAEAEAQGMALRLPLSAATRAAGLDRLVVFGVRSDLSASEGSNTLEYLLELRERRGELGILTPETPTNPSEDAPLPQAPPLSAAEAKRRRNRDLLRRATDGLNVLTRALNRGEAPSPLFFDSARDAARRLSEVRSALPDLEHGVQDTGHGATTDDPDTPPITDKAPASIVGPTAAAKTATPAAPVASTKGPKPTGDGPVDDDDPRDDPQDDPRDPPPGTYPVETPFERALAQALPQLTGAATAAELAGALESWYLALRADPDADRPDPGLLSASPLLTTLTRCMELCDDAPALQSALEVALSRLGPLSGDALLRQALPDVRSLISRAPTSVTSGGLRFLEEALELLPPPVLPPSPYLLSGLIQILDTLGATWQADPASAPWSDLPLGQWKQALIGAVQAPPTVPAEAEASRLSWALGMGGEVLRELDHAADQEEEIARAMNTVVWPATGGYFLQQMMGKMSNHTLFIDDADDAAVRRFFIDEVRAGGPLPTLSVGRQPYAFLPVVETAQGRWTHLEGDPALPLVIDTLARFRPLWLSGLGSVPRVGPGIGTEELAALLKRQARSTAFSARGMMGRFYLRSLLKQIGQPADPGDYSRWFQDQLVLSAQILHLLGVDCGEFDQSAPRIAGVAYTERALALTAPLVTPVGQDALAAGSLTGIIRVDPGEAIAAPSPTTLLEALVAMSAFAEASGAIRRLYRAERANMETNGFITFWEPEVYTYRQSIDELRAHSVWRTANQSDITGSETLRQWMRAWLTNPNRSAPFRTHVEPLLELASAATRLESAPAAQLERHLAGALDLVGHRIDAWMTAVASRRLAHLRASRPTGLYLGAYGWLEDIRPRGLATSDGFILAPSADQAITAAILRSGHLSHQEDGAGPLAIDLTSSRVRQALSLVDGARAGRDPGTLLGLELERALQAAGLGAWIHDLRALAPAQGIPSASTAAAPAADGLAILRRWQEDPAQVRAALQPPPTAGSPEDLALEAVLAAVAAAADSVSDLLLAEAVHQASRGNNTRAAASLEALAGGQPPPPSFEVLETPRRFTPISHHLAALGAPPEAPTAAATVDEADPLLAAWAEGALGPLGDARLRIRWTDASGAPVAEEVADLTAAGLDPLGLIALLSPSAADPAWPWRRLIALGRARPAGVPAEAQAAVVLERDPAEPPSQLSAADLVAVGLALRGLLESSRPLEAADLVGVGAAQVQSLATDALVADLDARLATLQADLELAASQGDRAGLIAALSAAARWGILEALPPEGYTDSLAQAAGLAREAIGRRRQAGGAAAPAADRARALVGLPWIISDALTVGPQQLAGALSPTVPGGDEALRRWLETVAPVRRGAAALGELLLLGDALGRAAPTLIATQSPGAGEAWAGLAGVDPATGGRSCALAMAAGGLDPATGRVAGRIFDEWTETIPVAEQDAAVSFQYDRPSQEPPQCILLALPATAVSTWTLTAVEGVLGEALTQVRLRSIDLEDLPGMGQLLPATALPFNPVGETASLDPRF